MGIISSGFQGRRNRDDPGLPPGQHRAEDFPVLSAGPTPRIARADWEFRIVTETGTSRHWDWAAFLALPQEDITADIHCVTSWSKLGTHWRGVALDTLFDQIETTARFSLVHSYGGYTTNVPLADLLGGKAWIVHQFNGADLPSEHGGPARLLVPHLYFWKSAKWVRGLELTGEEIPGFWETNGYHAHGDPWREERYG
ncbi:sulfite oxidase-like oxidoreductase [Arthrobacter sp. I2-34]|uniref:Sulfite oxidase-like oxidoreductase n=1 Tax=Arthrobacter hankyongi TaxID=2904801 RepID=A0ABS9LB97_9MICC|nr:sulfite oxidase-like oxidoreductase [Arthrobacter hankyongi]MCG2623744.1 sulfite oxidase-like oxidoreductase [Arthrobacter hankyongi]